MKFEYAESHSGGFVMDDVSQRAKPVMEYMLQVEVDELFEHLGLALETIKQKPTAANSIELPELVDEESLGLGDDAVRNLQAFGRDFYARVNKDAYNLFCGNDAKNSKERDKLVDAFKLGPEAVAASMAAFLIAQLGLSPLIAVAVAAITVKLFFRNAHAAMCNVWKGNVISPA